MKQGSASAPEGIDRGVPHMFITYLLERYRAWLRYRQTLNELSRLSERELADVGLNRYDIDTTARRYAEI